jgi:hypothetical protein
MICDDNDNAHDMGMMTMTYKENKQSISIERQ